MPVKPPLGLFENSAKALKKTQDQGTGLAALIFSGSLPSGLARAKEICQWLQKI